MVVFFAKHLHAVVMYIDTVYLYMHLKIAPIFSKGGAGFFISKVLLLIAIPILIAAVPALIYRLIKGSNMPYFIELCWGLWLIIVLSNIMIR